MKTQLLRFTGAVVRDPAVERWMRDHPDELGATAQLWFDAMRASGDDVRELLHDGAPTACIDDAGFGYVNAFRAHVNVGFFRGADLPDPAGILEGTGKFMRHVKLRPRMAVDADALLALIRAAYADMKRRVEAEARARTPGHEVTKPMSSAITFAVAKPDDARELADLRVAAMRDSLERIGRFDPVRARERFLGSFSPEHTRHVVRDGARIGFVVVKPDGDDLLLDHLYVSAQHQGQGVGAAVLAQVFAEADTAGRRIRVGALRGSDSNRFYVRHGFVLVEEAEFDLYYVRPSARTR